MRTEKLINGILVTNEDGTVVFTNRFGKVFNYSNMDEYLEANKAEFKTSTIEEALAKIEKQFSKK